MTPYASPRTRAVVFAAVCLLQLAGAQAVLAGATPTTSRLARHPSRLFQPHAVTALIPVGAGRSPAPQIVTPPGIGPNLLLSPPDSNFYSTTVAAVNPTNSAELFAGSDIDTAPPQASFRSHDSGTTWVAGTVPLPGTPPNKFGAQSGPTFDTFGNLYDSYTAVATTSTSVATQLVVAKWPRGGTNWVPSPVIVESTATTAEKPMMTVDSTAAATSHPNRLYLVYDTNPARGSEPLVVAHSDDGVVWSKTQVFDSGGDYGGFPAVGPAGVVYVVWHDWASFAAGRLLLAKSTDGGQTFLAPFSTISSAGNGFGTTLPNFGNTTAPCPSTAPLVSPTPSLAVDRSGGPHTGTLYVTWADKPFSTTMHIFFSRSTDGGASWSLPAMLDTGNRHDAWQPALSVDQSNGTVTVSWYDRRDDPANKLYNVYYTQSANGGLDFLPAQVRISTAQSDPTVNCFGTGDYAGIAAAGGLAHPVWADARNGLSQVFTATISELILGRVTLQSDVVFRGATEVPVGPRASLVVSADVNDDGRPDAVASSNNGLTVLLNQGNGTFQAEASRLGPAGVMVMGDFNQDGRLDLASVNGGLTVSLGSGDGAFQPGFMLSNVCSFSSVATGDFDRDGNLDLVLASSSSCGATVLLGKGNGSFQPPQSYAFGPSPDTSNNIAVGDFNGDGNLDIAAADWNGVAGSITVLLGNGHGGFGSPVERPVAGNPQQLAVADFNGDGRPDVAVSVCGCGAGTSGLYIMLGNGNGTFGTATNTGAGTSLTAFSVGDLSRDGKPDLVVANQGNGGTDSGSFAVLLGKGDGSFGSPATYAVGFGPSSVAIADFNGDGKPDLAVANQFSADLDIIAGNGDGTFALAPTISGGQSPGAVAAGDFNDDGILDLAVTNQVGYPVTGNISIFLGKGDGTFQLPMMLAVGGIPAAVVAADFNRDGKLDLAVTFGSAGPAVAAVLLGNGDGTFQAAKTTTVGGQPLAMVVGDFNHDGKPDIAIANFSAASVSVLIGNGDGSFATAAYSVPLAPVGVTEGDFNGDGNLDLVTADSPGGVSVLLGNSNGTFQPVVNYTAGSGPNAVTVGDFNGDGKADLAVTNGAGGFSVLLGKGDGTFDAPVPTPGPSGGFAITTGDFNHDGRTDLLIGKGASMSFWRGNGDGTFRLPSNYPTGGSGSPAVVGDFNGDGMLDLATPDVTVLLGLPSAPRVSAPPGTPTPVRPRTSRPSSQALSPTNGQSSAAPAPVAPGSRLAGSSKVGRAIDAVTVQELAIDVAELFLFL